MSPNQFTIMKRYKFLSLAVLTATALLASCTHLLEEHPRSVVVPAYLGTPAGMLGGIAGVYNDIRNSWGTEGFTINQMAGTDEHLMGGSAGNQTVYTYNAIQPSAFSGSFGMYADINTLNGVISYGPSSGLDDATMKAYLGQAKFLRAFIYFYLVQTFGNIPLHTTFITVPSQADAPAAPSAIYDQIISDLTDASATLPNTPTAPFLGKAATKAAAQWLLAKVYLTRGWLLSNNSDFTQAYQIASDLITNKGTYGLDLWANYADAFKPANDYGKENIFVSDHSFDSKYGVYQIGAAGGNGVNVVPWMGLFNGPAVLGINSTVNANGKIGNTGDQMLFRDVPFGRPFTRIRPNSDRVTVGPNTGKSYLYDQAFQDRINDSRFWKTFQTVWLANLSATGTNAYSGSGKTGSRGTLTCGQDTAVWFPDYEVPGAPQAFGARPFKGIIVTPTMQSNTVYPYMQKWADPSRAAPNDPSSRPVVIARLSDVYMIAAEAAFKAGNSQQAADMINVVRKRAAFRTNTLTKTNTTVIDDRYPGGVTQSTAEAAMLIDQSQVTLDFILDERTREFYGESVRWLDLVRTKSLLSRVAAWNPVEAGTLIKDFNVLRPIPQDQIQLVTQGPPYPQNPGY